MCGRINVSDNPLVQWMFDVLGIPFTTTTNTDLRPTECISAVALINDQIRQLNGRWGIKPDWSKKLLINATFEKAVTSPFWKPAFFNRRCLVPCNGWYETSDRGKKTKEKYAITHAENGIFLMAGIWFETQDGPKLVTFTREATEKYRQIKDRMPLIISPDDLNFWLKGKPHHIHSQIRPASDQTINIQAC